MVMEMPSPVCVGREFVRQYYTMLHEAPEHLHRFYSNNSSFVHGGVEKPGEEQPPVTGQTDIHKKIMSLNFHDCHAKIRQVDSQATVDRAVVIQVTGELSNNGLPMRRFMQTFLLAPQSAKKYYVHNDIFRYQDEVFHDSDNDTETREETGDSEQEVVDSSSNAVEPVGEPSVPSYPSYCEPAAQTLSNGSAHEEHAEASEEKPVVASQEDEEEMEVEKVSEETEAPQESQPYEDKEPEKTPTPEPPSESHVEAPKPCSWAAITSKNTTHSASASVAPPQPVQVSKPQALKPEMRPDTGPAPQPQRAPRTRPDRTPRDRDNSRGGGENEDTRRSRFPDSQQLFVGNLPQTMSDKDLQKFFEQYGKVVEVRINKKSSNRDVPNFGFVVFDDPEVVQNVLENKPILLNGEHRLNVEEKKQRGEQSGRPGSGTRMGGRPGGSNMGPMGRMGAGGRGGRGGPPSLGGGPGRPENRGSSGGRGGYGQRR